MIVEAPRRDRLEFVADHALAEAAAAVVAATDGWLQDGLCPGTGLALVQNALPLTVADDGGSGSRLQRRSHARAVVALLLLVDDDEAGVIATCLHELLAGPSAPARADGGDHPDVLGAG